MTWHRLVFLAASLATPLIGWPVAAHWVVEPALATAERLGGALGELASAVETIERGEPGFETPPPPEGHSHPLDAAELERELELERDAQEAAPAPEASKQTREQRKRGAIKTRQPHNARALPAPRHGIRVDQATVRRLSKARAIPEGQFVSATKQRPAGLRLSGVSRLGIGLRDGDVLTHVAGAPVSEKGQVINRVVQARSRRASNISARFFRNDEPWMLVVEQPYPRRKRARETAQERNLVAKRSLEKKPPQE